MEDIKREELISAYLDGELDATEAARVEQWIAEDPQAKKLFEDLKLMQDAIHRLPRHPLESDLTRGVLDQITDQSVVSESQHSGAFIAASYSEDYSIDKEPTRRERVFAKYTSEYHQNLEENLPSTEFPQRARRRIYLWPATAIAAAVLLMIFSNSEQKEKDGLVVQRDASVRLKNLPSQQGSIKSMEINAFELPVESRADKGQISNDRTIGESKAHARENYQSMNKAAPPRAAARDIARDAPQDKDFNSLPVYTFGVSPSLDLTRQLEDLMKDAQQIGLIKLGVREKSESTHHIFELYGDAEAIDKIMNSLKTTEGIILASRAFVTPKETEKEQSTMRHFLRNKFDLFSTEGVDIQTVPGPIRLIFVVPSS